MRHRPVPALAAPAGALALVALAAAPARTEAQSTLPKAPVPVTRSTSSIPVVRRAVARLQATAARPAMCDSVVRFTVTNAGEAASQQFVVELNALTLRQATSPGAPAEVDEKATRVLSTKIVNTLDPGASQTFTHPVRGRYGSYRIRVLSPAREARAAESSATLEASCIR
jgi:hypothetical protein